MSPWTKVSKAAESSTVTVAGTAEPIGMLLVITSVTSAPQASVTSGWGNIANPTSSTWTTVAKPVSSTWTNVSKPTD